jgi:hypothetical protein
MVAPGGSRPLRRCCGGVPVVEKRLGSFSLVDFGSQIRRPAELNDCRAVAPLLFCSSSMSSLWRCGRRARSVIGDVEEVVHDLITFYFSPRIVFALCRTLL